MDQRCNRVGSSWSQFLQVIRVPTPFTNYAGVTRIGSREKRNYSFDDVELINAIAELFLEPRPLITLPIMGKEATPTYHVNNYGKRSFYYRGAMIWNSLPSTVTEATNFSKFVRLYHDKFS